MDSPRQDDVITQKLNARDLKTVKPVVNIIIMNCPPRDAEALATQLFMQGGTPAIVSDRKREGALLNAIQAFEVALELGGPVTIVQDDIEICQNFVPYMSKYLAHVERFRTIIQWFCNGLNVNEAWHVDKARLVERGADRFLSTQAVTYPREVAAYILPGLITARSVATPDDKGRYHGDDQHIQTILRQREQNFFIHVPNLVQHVGETSMVGPGIGLYDGFRQSKCFVGRGFNALQLEVPEPFNWRPRP